MHQDAHMVLCQVLIEELPELAADIITQLSLKSGIKCWKLKWKEGAKYYMNQLYLRDTYNPNHYKELTRYQKKSIF